MLHKGMLPIDKKIKDQIKDDLIELMTNVYYHSNSDNPFFVCGQLYPKDSCLKLTMTDLGEGFLPKILVNRMIYFQMNRYAKKKGDKVDPSYFKKVYREQPEFKLALQKIYDDFHIYARSCTLINDNFGQQGFGFTDLFTVNAPIIEFNDNYLYKLAKHHSAIVITDDGDFFVEDIPVYTLNNTLVNKAKALAVVGTDK